MFRGIPIALMFLCALFLIAVGCDEQKTTAALANDQPDAPQAAKPRGEKGDTTMDHTEKAIFAAGCFWGVEATFGQVKGVTNTRVGYTGGHVGNPTYKQVCTGRTGHAEAVEVTFDPDVVSYERLLETFWQSHDPTTPNRQGPDVGEQYRSAVFYLSDAQRETAERIKGKLEAGKVFKRPIVTEITKATTFWPAEEYHQRYLQKRGMAKCHF